MKAQLLVISAVAGLLLFHVQKTSAGQQDYTLELVTTYDFPFPDPSTTGGAINGRGQVAGHAVNFVPPRLAGFLRLADGRLSKPLIEPDAGPGGTEAFGINDDQMLCGDYYDVAGIEHGFFFSARLFSQFDVPGGSGTSVQGLNNGGDFVGNYIDSGSGLVSAFVDIGGQLTTIAIPGSDYSSAEQINNAGDVVGYYIGNDSLLHGFYRDAAGNLTTIDFPASTGTMLLGINDRGEMAGLYYDAAGVQHGFYLRPPGYFLTYDFPGARATALHGINPHRTISGNYTDTSGARHGLIVQVQETN